MEVFLIVVAAVVVGLLLALVLALLLLKWYVRSRLKGFGDTIGKAFEQIAAMAGPGLPGLKISLKPAEQTPWHHPAEVAQAVDLLTGKGFVEIDRYLVNGSSAILLGLYHHPAERVVTTLYDTKDSPPKMDVCASYEDGERFVFFTNVKHDGLDKPPYTRYQRLHDLSNEALLDRALAELPGEGRDPVVPGEIIGVIEKVYEREQLWRINRGGYTEQEIIYTLKAAGEPVTQETIEASRSAMNESLGYELDDFLREQFLDTTNFSARRWEEVEDRFIVIHPISDADDLLNALATLYPEDEHDRVEERLEKTVRERLKESSPMAVFAELAQGTPKFDQLEKLGEIREPVSAVFYATPPYENEADDD